MIEIRNSQLNDLPKIMELYTMATAFMESKNQVAWPTFQESMIEEEIKAGKQWKLLINEEVACIWATTFSDPIIWGEKNNDPAVYIHRITTNPKFRGNNLTQKLVIWGKDYAKKEHKNVLRLDTVGLNQPLIAHYKKLGFTFLGSKKLSTTKGLPEHYSKGDVCFFEMSV